MKRIIKFQILLTLFLLSAYSGVSSSETACLIVPYPERYEEAWGWCTKTDTGATCMKVDDFPNCDGAVTVSIH